MGFFSNTWINGASRGLGVISGGGGGIPSELFNATKFWYSDGDGTGGMKAPAVLTTPTINSITGTPTQGSTVTLNVSNATTQRNGDMFFDDFQSGTLGQLIDPAKFTQGNPGTGISNHYLYDASQSVVGTQSARFDSAVADDDEGPYALIDTNSSDKLWFSYCMRQTPHVAGGGAQHKLGRAISDVFEHSSGPLLGASIAYDINQIKSTIYGPEYIGKEGGSGDNYDIDASTSSLWTRVIGYIDCASGLEVADGSIFLRFIPMEGAGTTCYSFQRNLEPRKYINNSIGDNAAPHSGWDTNSDFPNYLDSAPLPQTGLIERFILPSFKRKEQHQETFVGSIHLNDSLERVEIGNAPLMEDCTKIFQQHQVSRSASQIVVDIELAKSYFGVEQKYVFVVNSTGEYSEGFAI